MFEKLSGYFKSDKEKPLQEKKVPAYMDFFKNATGPRQSTQLPGIEELQTLQEQLHRITSISEKEQGKFRPLLMSLVSWYIGKVWEEHAQYLEKQKDMNGLFILGKQNEIMNPANIFFARRYDEVEELIQTINSFSKTTLIFHHTAVRKRFEEVGSEQQEQIYFSVYSKLLALGISPLGNTMDMHIMGGIMNANNIIWGLQKLIYDLHKTRSKREISRDILKETYKNSQQLVTHLTAGNFPLLASFLIHSTRRRTANTTEFAPEGFDLIHTPTGRALDIKEEILKKIHVHLLEKNTPRFGCPILNAKYQDSSVMHHYIEWQNKLAEEYYYPIVTLTQRK